MHINKFPICKFRLIGYSNLQKLGLERQINELSDKGKKLEEDKVKLTTELKAKKEQVTSMTTEIKGLEQQVGHLETRWVGGGGFSHLVEK